MEYKNRINVNVLGGQDNIFANKAKTQSLKGGLQVNATRRHALGDICSNNNIRLQPPSLVGKSQDVPEKEKKTIGVRPQIRSYKNITAKVDTRLPTKTSSATSLSNIENSQKPLRREESTMALAAKASIITARLRQTKISSGINIKKSESKENLILKEKKTRITSKLDSQVLKVPMPHKISEAKSEASISSLVKKDSYSTELLDGVEDIDAGDKKNPILMAIYIKDIYSYLRELEIKFPIKAQHLDGQMYMTPKMRSMLIDWLVQVHSQFNLLLETLHLTVAIIDRYLQIVKTIERVQIQLVGITAMFIASKYEEMFPPDISDYVYIADNTYTKREILKCERSILMTLDFCLGRPLPLHFVRRLIKAAGGTKREHFLAKYLVDLSLIEYQMAHYRPSELASAAVCLSLSLISPHTHPQACWNSTLSFYSGYSYRCLSPLIKELAGVLVAAETCRYKAVSDKYGSSKHDKVSKYPEIARAGKLSK